MPIAYHRSKRCARLFDHLVGAGEQRRRHLDAEGLRRRDIDHQLELRGLLNLHSIVSFTTPAASKSRAKACAGRLGIIRHEQMRNAADHLEGTDMGVDPIGRLLRPARIACRCRNQPLASLSSRLSGRCGLWPPWWSTFAGTKYFALRTFAGSARSTPVTAPPRMVTRSI